LLIDLDALADHFRPFASRNERPPASASSSTTDNDSTWLSANEAVCAVVQAVIQEWERVGSEQLQIVLSAREEDIVKDSILAALPCTPMVTSSASRSKLHVPLSIAPSVNPLRETTGEQSIDINGPQLIEAVTGCSIKDLAGAEAKIAAAEAAVLVDTMVDADAGTGFNSGSEDEIIDVATSVSQSSNYGFSSSKEAAAAVAAARCTLSEANREVRLVAALRSLTTSPTSSITPLDNSKESGVENSSMHSIEMESNLSPLHPSEVLVVTSLASESTVARLAMDGARYVNEYRWQDLTCHFTFLSFML